MGSTIFYIFYYIVVCLLSIYGLHRYYLVFLYYRHKSHKPQPKSHFSELPIITVQLPLYNERYVIERLLGAISRLRYPKDKMQIQVLDDSTDETTSITEKLTQKLSQEGFWIDHLHRKNRHGFKAGALDQGLQKAQGEFVYIFDADFIPKPNFIQQTLHFFTDSTIGVVQARWDHINRSYSLLTQLQSIFLDGHFIIEHTARNRSGLFFNFNGTAGAWRKTAISDAGGWEHDTLTEDLDLSYRAQLKGWKFIYLPEIASPAEVPVEIHAFKAQQHRWVKGSIQTGKKLLPRIWKSKIPLRVKLEATFHLTNNLSYPLMMIFFLMLLPAMFLEVQELAIPIPRFDTPIFLASFFSISAFYLCSQRELFKNWAKQLKFIPLLSSLGIGMSVNNARAVIEALLNRSSSFQRTPKYGEHASKDSWKEVKYRGKKSKLIWLELVFALYFGILILISVMQEKYFLTPFLVLFHVGFLQTWFLSKLHNRKEKSLGWIFSKTTAPSSQSA